MDRGLRERVRWGNVGRALGLVALVALVAAWPALAPDAPVVPGREAVPVVPAPTATPVPRVRPPRVVRPRRVMRPRKRPRAPERTRRRVAPAVRRKHVRHVVRAVRRAGEGGGGAVPVRAAPVVTAAPPVSVTVQGSAAPADPDPVLREFGPEGP
jgi:hypothetical protein